MRKNAKYLALACAGLLCLAGCDKLPSKQAEQGAARRPADTLAAGELYFQNVAVANKQWVKPGFDVHVRPGLGQANNNIAPYAGNPFGENMMLDDLRALSSQGDGLNFSHLAPFMGVNASSDTRRVIMVYPVGERHRLVVTGTGRGEPDSVSLEDIYAPGGEGIDIRHENIDAFLGETFQ